MHNTPLGPTVHVQHALRSYCTMYNTPLGPTVCAQYLHALQGFEKCEGHASSDDHLVHLVQQVVDQFDFIMDLSSTDVQPGA